MRSILLIVIFCLVNLFSLAQKKYPKKIIQFGWDYPTITFLKKNLRSMERKPFDGVAFSFDFRIYDLFDSTIYTVDKFQFDDLKKIPWRKFTDNFIRVRAQSLNGPNWLNDSAWEKVAINIRNISKALSLSNSKGIFFDPEYYYHSMPEKNPWVYNSKLYPEMSYKEVGAFVKKRGKQFIAALQSDMENPHVFSFWMLSLVTLQARMAPLEETGMALYPFFIEGIIEGKNPNTVITDGNELGYSYMSERQFIFSGDEIRNWGVAFMPDFLKPAYAETRVSQPIFYDLIFATFPQYEKNFTEKQKEDWLASNLYFAFKTSDQYVWFYNSKIDWWRSDNTRLEGIIKKVKRRLADDYKRTSKRLVSGKSFSWDFLADSIKFDSVFNYTLNTAEKTLNVKFIDGVESFYIFENSRLIAETQNPSGTLEVNLADYNPNANLILVAKKGKYVVSFVN